MKPTKLSLMAILLYTFIFLLSAYADTENEERAEHDLIKLTRQQAQCILDNKEIYISIDRALVLLVPDACPKIGAEAVAYLTINSGEKTHAYSAWLLKTQVNCLLKNIELKLNADESGQVVVIELSKDCDHDK